MAGPFYDVGAYVGEVIDQGLTETQGGNAQFVLRVKILGTPDGDTYTEVRNQYERTVYMVLTEKTMDFQRENLEKLGFTGTSLAQLDPSHPEYQSFVGNQVDLWCKHEAYKGKTSEKWQISNGSQGIERKPIDAKGLKKLDMLFGRSRRAAGKTSTGANRPADDDAVGGAHNSGQQNEFIDDDDIPF